jgi:hypothetical protein
VRIRERGSVRRITIGLIASAVAACAAGDPLPGQLPPPSTDATANDGDAATVDALPDAPDAAAVDALDSATEASATVPDAADTASDGTASDTTVPDVAPDAVLADADGDVEPDLEPDIEDDQQPLDLDVFTPECQAPKDCDDDLPCTIDTCQQGLCGHLKASGPCSDGNGCTAGDACKDGACVPGKAKDCDDQSPCTDDFCVPATGECIHAPNLNACSDAIPCTTGETCVNGSCGGGTAKNCGDANACTDDACAAKTGACIHVNKTTACDDGNPCTAGDVCSGGACKSGQPVPCNDKNPCTDDSCDGKTGSCVQKPNSKACEDGNPCTTGDACKDAGCVPGPVTCACTPGGSGKDCDDNNPCTIDTCDKVGGKPQCQNQAQTGTGCNDGDACTDLDSCQAGQCTGKPKPPCDDKNPCTTDTCDPKTGTCAFANHTNPCSDGNACTIGDACKNGACLPGAVSASACDDGNPCTVDACDPNQGGCQHATPECAGSKCAPAQCDPKTGLCVTASKACGDGDPCTRDNCDPVSGGCKSTAWTGLCDDGEKCSAPDRCVGGACKPGPIPCDDGNPCTVEQCDAASGACKLANAPDGVACEDGAVCTTGQTCKLGQCQGGQAKNCADTLICSVDWCHPLTGKCKNIVFSSCNKCSTTGNQCSTSTMCIAPVCMKTIPYGGPCNNYSICQEGMCTLSGSKKYCLTTNKPGGEKCFTSTECQSATCKKGVCGCKSASQCKTAEWCTADGSCAVDLPYGATCANSDPCPTGSACVASGAPDPSGSSTMRCLAPTAATGQACMWAGECTSKVCGATGTCGCATSKDCGSKQLCKAGACVSCCLQSAKCKACAAGPCQCGLDTLTVCDAACNP